MASDAFMELSPPGELIGESGDICSGKDTPYQMFEISSFEFETGGKSGTKNEIKVPGPDGKNQKIKLPGKTGGAPTGTDPKTDAPKFTITKSIDSSSADLFRYCCENSFGKDENSEKKIEFAIVTIRKAGGDRDMKDADDRERIWLRLEFRKLKVVEFKWDLDPDASGEAAMKRETVSFEFDWMEIRYWPQQPDGTLGLLKSKSWNFADANAMEPANAT
jgi:type VI protein secretion system component Hcp